MLSLLLCLKNLSKYNQPIFYMAKVSQTLKPDVGQTELLTIKYQTKNVLGDTQSIEDIHLLIFKYIKQEHAQK